MPWTSPTKDLVLVRRADADVSDTARVTWTATAADRGDRFSGETSVEVRDLMLNPDIVARIV